MGVGERKGLHTAGNILTQWPWTGDLPRNVPLYVKTSGLAEIGLPEIHRLRALPDNSNFSGARGPEAEGWTGEPEIVIDQRNIPIDELVGLYHSAHAPGGSVYRSPFYLDALVCDAGLRRFIDWLSCRVQNPPQGEAAKEGGRAGYGDAIRQSTNACWSLTSVVVAPLVPLHYDILEMMTLRGSHGTCVSKADRAIRNGFHGRRGRGGTGVYLWKDSKLSLELAKRWYYLRKGEGAYDSEDNQSGIILLLSISVHEREHVDFEDTQWKDELFEVAQAQGFPTDKAGYSHYGALYDFYLSELEKEVGYTIAVVELRVAWPKDTYPEYPVGLMGAPVSYIVRVPSRLDVTRKIRIRV